ncbi:MAG TPA: ADP-ribosylglycohydrolase family protein [Actinomycetota bacterium]
MDRRDRARGTMVGLVVGNALGIPFEGSAGASIPAGAVGEIPESEADAPWDDDVALAVMLAEAAIERGAMEVDDLAARLLAWYRENPRGIGILTSRVLVRLDRGADPHAAAREVWEESGRTAAGNGAVMRCAPLALRWWRDPERLAAETLASAGITHADPRCGWSAVTLNRALAAVLSDQAPDLEALAEDAWRGAGEEYGPEIAEAVVASAEAARPADLSLDGGDMGYTLKTMQVGLWALVRAGDLEASLVSVIEAGGDTDTNGAVGGASLGCRDGLEAIPARWLERAPRRERLLELADALIG